MVGQLDDDQSVEDVFSVNDWDLERGIFNMTISLVQQKALRMGPEAGRIAVISFLESLVSGLQEEPEAVEDRIEEFLHKQRDGDKE